jgi:MscS family membrane protein
VIVLLYLDFTKNLEDKEQALVKQVVTEIAESLFGIEPGSKNITFIAVFRSVRYRLKLQSL